MANAKNPFPSGKRCNASEADAATALAARNRALARVLPLWPHEIADISIEGRRRVVALLSRALRAERQRGRAGHWTYDVARHAALFRAYGEEHAALRKLERHQPAQTAQQPLR